jgi:dCMP deaminase
MTKQIERPDWDEYWMSMAIMASKRSTCLRRKVGAVLVDYNQILSMGYNGAPCELDHCDETGCLRQKLNIPSGERAEICRAVHAEQNAIIQAAKHGVSIAGATLYVTTSPCSICAKMLINAEIEEIVYLEHYPDDLADKMLKDADINVRQLL